ncbi:MAG: putative hydrolase (HAD superfamily) [Candidatus Levybacteria bacterium GW2011_GWA1_39_32]|nr:MAG: putative hydrolase (HAD superfamily) [Candidatus Levybacteria bacterium GW2011_GWB1_36_18]KKR15233.1 MAG: putative hydrolase (HAD superfamily) [Candidatus Levybacteria bacterium GW2011_GWA1_39_32]
MITTILSDLSRVILNPKDKNYKGTLNGLYKELLSKNSKFNFYDYFEFDEEVLNLYSSLKSKYSLNLFTTGSIQNASEAQEKLELVFDNIYSAEDYSLDKKDPDAYKFIAKKLNIDVSQILYIDDQTENIIAAKSADLNVFHYEEYNQLANKIREILA